MEKYELEQNLKEEIRSRTLGADFMKLVQTVRRNGKQFKIALRPVEIGGERKFQAEMTDDGQVQVKNLSANAAAEGLEEIIAQKGARDLHLMTAKGDLHVRVTKKGHVLVSRSAEMDRVVTLQPHDRVKKVPLNEFDSTALLRAIGISDGEGRVRASMRGKYDQVNEFLKVVKETVSLPPHPSPLPPHPSPLPPHPSSLIPHPSSLIPHPFLAIDCGCGKAYLTISLYFYLTEVLKFPDVTVVGIDRRSDVISAAKKMAAQLDVAERVLFLEADLSTVRLQDLPLAPPPTPHPPTNNHPPPPPTTNQQPPTNNHQPPPPTNNQQPPTNNHQPPPPTLIVSLHACDTATDEALAKGVEWKAAYVLSAPCCQHELQKTLTDKGAFAGLMRQSILRERLCDILTDSFRAMIMRILGFKTQVIEFVSSEATARNILLKCEYGVKPGQPGPVGEYLGLRDYWKVTPWLETRLASFLGKYFERFE